MSTLERIKTILESAAFFLYTVLAEVFRDRREEK